MSTIDLEAAQTHAQALDTLLQEEFEALRTQSLERIDALQADKVTRLEALQAIARQIEVVGATLRSLQLAEPADSVDLYDRMGQVARRGGRRAYSEA